MPTRLREKAILCVSSRTCGERVPYRRWRVTTHHLVSRLGDFTEVADLVAFLASPRASYIHAASLQIDGV